jgi:hypothetical protein
MFPCDFVFRVIIPLNLVESSSLVARDSVLLVKNLDGMCLVCQIGFQWDGIFDNNISRRFQTSFELVISFLRVRNASSHCRLHLNLASFSKSLVISLVIL